MMPKQLRHAVLLPGGRSISITLSGSGPRTVILCAGLGSGVGAWDALDGKWPKGVKRLAYDRAGWGESSPGPIPRCASSIVSDLRAVVAALELSPPYHFAAYSAGAFDALYFAFHHREEIASMLLLDPSVTHMEKKLHPLSAGLDCEWSNEQAALSQRIRMHIAEPRAHNHAERNALLRLRCQASETRNFYGLSSDEVETGWRSLGDLPIIVLSCRKLGVDASDLPAILSTWRFEHDRYAHLSTIGVRRDVDSTHAAIISHIDTANAVSEILQKAL